MASYSKTMREKARELYLTGEVLNVAEIARQLKVKPHTVGHWRKDEDWDSLRLKIDRRVWGIARLSLIWRKTQRLPKSMA